LTDHRTHLLCSAGGGASGLAAGLLMGALRRRRSPAVAGADVETLFDAPIVARISRSKTWPAVSFADRGQTMEAISALRGRLLRCRDDRTITCVGLLSVVPSTGTTCVVDGNILSPAVHERLGLDINHGWLAAVAGTGSVQKCLQPTTEPYLMGLPTGPITDQSHDLVASDRRHQLVQRLAEKFDTVLLDLPPLAAGASCTVQLRGLQGVFLVLGGSEPLEMLTQAQSDLTHAGVSVLGIVLNRR
jgi:Mrp family chromosome partitioning ATPase